MLSLEGGRTASFRVAAIPFGNRGTIRFVKDAALSPTQHPIGCPAVAPTVRIRTSAGYDSGEITLPCEKWKPSGTGYRYRDNGGAAFGVRSLVYRPSKLVLRFKGEGFTPPTGPLGEGPFLDLYFNPGSQPYCGRFEEFRKESAAVLRAAKESTGCIPEGPNIVLILGDDVDWRRLAFLGEDSRMLTPALDDLASEGVTFPAGHLSASLCAPMHHHLLTGVHHESSFVPTWRELPREMLAAGRRTFQAGKLWQKPGSEWGFEQNAGEICHGPPPGFFTGCGNPAFGQADWDVASCGILGDPEVPCPATEAWRTFLGTLTPKERFFAMISPRLPHAALDPLPEYVALYAGQPMSGPEPVYLPMVTWLDGVVGEIVADLESAGLREDTLIVYAADNGYRSDAAIAQAFDPEAWRGKGSLAEMGMRSPLIFSWPAAMSSTQGERLSGVAGVEDLFATLLAVAGRPVPTGVQGYDLSSSWEGGAPSPRPHIVTHFVSPRVSGWIVRTSSWRYVRDDDNGTEHLYAIDVDPDEQIDLIGSATPQQLAEFDQMIQDWRTLNE